MSKLRSDSAWSKLTAEPREMLELAQKEFGLASSLTGLADFYQRLAEERAGAMKKARISGYSGLFQDKLKGGWG